MVKKKLVNQIKKDFLNLVEERKVLGILIFGSHVIDKQTNRSDVDICVVAPKEDPFKLYSVFTENINIASKNYDIKFFSNLPLYLQIQIIEDGIVVYSPNELDLYEYFYPFRKLWADQKHRQELTKEELLSLLE
ncbi:MAG: DNA polymerase subunit beta [Candidatus Lokiarchaeota archaeon]|nr:DNA polymerase subunit beta [Candidatus Lokiarchaeota archaeon]MBD3342338.1 DNA polymerase subunit beta [Candidatus Lokiarchaeota archaeon]